MEKEEILEGIRALFEQAALTDKDKKALLQQAVSENWPGLPVWSTLKSPIVEEVQKVSVGSGILVTFVDGDGVRKAVMGEAGPHYKTTEPAFTIPGGFINLTETPGSVKVPPAKDPEDAFVGAAREIEEEFRLPDGAPLLAVDPSRLELADTKTIVLPWGEHRVVMGLTLELNREETAIVKAHVAKLESDPAYKAAVAEKSANEASGKPELASVQIIPLGDLAAGKVKLLHQDQLSLFHAVQKHYALATNSVRGIRKIYYAHPISMYGTPEEAAVVSVLEKVGYKVESPSNPEHVETLPKIRAQFASAAEGSAAVMRYFVEVCNGCDAVAFSPFPDGSLGAGVVKEVRSFLDRNAPAILVSSEAGNITLRPVDSLAGFHCLTVDETRAMLKKPAQNPDVMKLKKPASGF